MRRTLLSALVLVLALPAASGAGRGRDPLLAEQWGLTAIDAAAAWATSRGAGAVVAILDSGVDLEHPDLVPNLAGRGYDALKGRPGVKDEAGHGTWVAGIAAASGGNGQGISGVAPAARILPVKVCEAECPPAAVAAGIRYAVRHGADVLNLSFYVAGLDEGLPEVLDALELAQRKGVVVVGAAGNSSEPWCAEPAASVLCVGAVDRDDLRTTYTNDDVAMQSDFLVAPGGSGLSGDCGEMIVSTAVVAELRACPAGAHYAYGTGTSGAAPFVTGVAALLAGMGASGAEIRDCIIGSADDLGPPGRDPIYGYGRLDALGAVECAG